ncbi:hypothetical protein D9599_22115 [Roseomonas sp. KE2513]|uniref:hypothetical protein n=1 Tax=Roseomonas sp. KE2513 TaxID=2479202 RepID=UPI0018E062DF|nr:hypothetical protein [Roseomonas sp. KE2513]MBI0538264.1 hypothetical protein [Roseomonas sp. KE2513]
MDENRPPYRPLTDTPADQPDERRHGVVRVKPGQPFKHYCPECGRWGAFKFGGDLIKGTPGVWYCDEHRGVGERRWKAAGGLVTSAG